MEGYKKRFLKCINIFLKKEKGSSMVANDIKTFLNIKNKGLLTTKKNYSEVWKKRLRI